MNETTPPPKDEQLHPERFQITDMQGVSWFLKKLLEKDTQAAALRAELETVSANYAAMLESIEQDKRGLEFLYAAQVREVARAEAERTRRKSVTTPYGVLAFRQEAGAHPPQERNDSLRRPGFPTGGRSASTQRPLYLRRYCPDSWHDHHKPRRECLPQTRRGALREDGGDIAGHGVQAQRGEVQYQAIQSQGSPRRAEL